MHKNVALRYIEVMVISTTLVKLIAPSISVIAQRYM